MNIRSIDEPWETDEFPFEYTPRKNKSYWVDNYRFKILERRLNYIKIRWSGGYEEEIAECNYYVIEPQEEFKLVLSQLREA